MNDLIITDRFRLVLSTNENDTYFRKDLLVYFNIHILKYQLLLNDLMPAIQAISK